MLSGFLVVRSSLTLKLAKNNPRRGRAREGSWTGWNSPLCHSLHAPVTKRVLRRFTSRRVFILFIGCHYLLQDDFKREVPLSKSCTNSPAVRDATQHPAWWTVLFFNATETDSYCEFILIYKQLPKIIAWWMFKEFVKGATRNLC